MSSGAQRETEMLNRAPFNDYVFVPAKRVNRIGLIEHFRLMVPDPMSKGCQQHGAFGEATLHPEDWDCDGCVWKPNGETK